MIGYDLRYQPLSIGDFVDFMQVGKILGDKYIGIFYDPNNPTKGDPRLTHVNSATFDEFIAKFRCMTDKVIPNSQEYDWPTLDIRRQYLFYHIYNTIFINGVLPMRFKSQSWAEFFLRRHGTRFCVQLRKSPNSHSANRDTDYDAWITFFKRSKERFMLLGDTDDRCRLDNTVIAKDHNTNLEQDLSIAAAADVFMGTPSGMASAVLFNDKPYKIFRANLNPKRCGAYSTYKGVGKWAWAKENQDYIVGNETVESIETEFAKCYR